MGVHILTQCTGASTCISRITKKLFDCMLLLIIRSFVFEALLVNFLGGFSFSDAITKPLVSHLFRVALAVGEGAYFWNYYQGGSFLS